jgi:hypothetical protein
MIEQRPATYRSPFPCAAPWGAFPCAGDHRALGTVGAESLDSRAHNGLEGIFCLSLTGYASDGLYEPIDNLCYNRVAGMPGTSRA